MLHDRMIIVHIYIREGVGSALVAEKQRVAAAVVAPANGLGTHLDETAVGILAMSCRDTLTDDCATRIAAEMDHFGTGVGLLVVIGDSD